MSKLTALGMSISLDDGSGSPQNITNDVGDFTLNTPRGVIDVSGLDKSGYERLMGRSDVTGTLNGFYDPGSNLAHAVLKTVPTQAGTLTRTLTVGFSTGTATSEVIVTDYAITIGNDGSMKWSAPFQATNGSALAWS